jgi:hypothetical protein
MIAMTLENSLHSSGKFISCEEILLARDSQYSLSIDLFESTIVVVALGYEEEEWMSSSTLKNPYCKRIIQSQ